MISDMALLAIIFLRFYFSQGVSVLAGDRFGTVPFSMSHEL